MGNGRNSEEADLISVYKQKIQELSDVIKSLEYSNYGRCPTCGYSDPNRREWHSVFGHAEDCNLAKLIGVETDKELDACDCYKPNRPSCKNIPLYNGKPFSERKL